MVSPERSETNTVFLAIWFPSVDTLTVAGVRVYAVVGSQLEEAIELFVRREDAEAMVEDVRRDEPELAETLAIEVITLGEQNPNWCADSAGPPL
jgi:predicted Fe-Mo cluster-binding NifX family protein